MRCKRHGLTRSLLAPHSCKPAPAEDQLAAFRLAGDPQKKNGAVGDERQRRAREQRERDSSTAC